MTIAALAVASLVVLAYLFLAVIAIRRPLLTRIAYRQVVRRPWQSALMVAGMVFGSAAILAAGLAPGARTASGFLLDGFPRTLGQVRILDAVLGRTRLSLDHAVLIDAPEEVLVRRLTGRRVCPACGAVYHLDSRPSMKPGRCDACGSKLVQRTDDRAETVTERLRIYREQTAPVVAVYRERGLLRTIDGSAAPEEVFEKVLTAVGGVAV